MYINNIKNIGSRENFFSDRSFRVKKKAVRVISLVRPLVSTSTRNTFGYNTERLPGNLEPFRYRYIIKPRNVWVQRYRDIKKSRHVNVQTFYLYIIWTLLYFFRILNRTSCNKLVYHL